LSKDFISLWINWIDFTFEIIYGKRPFKGVFNLNELKEGLGFVLIFFNLNTQFQQRPK